MRSGLIVKARWSRERLCRQHSSPAGSLVLQRRALGRELPENRPPPIKSVGVDGGDSRPAFDARRLGRVSELGSAQESFRRSSRGARANSGGARWGAAQSCERRTCLRGDARTEQPYPRRRRNTLFCLNLGPSCRPATQARRIGRGCRFSIRRDLKCENRRAFALAGSTGLWRVRHGSSQALQDSLRNPLASCIQFGNRIS